MPDWLEPAGDYLVRWLEFQMRLHEQPGCVVALAHRGNVVLEEAFGYADAVKRITLTPRHRFRVASHSKSFTAAGVMKLREQRRLSLGDRIGRYVHGLHPRAARVTIAQLLSHSAGLVRDGRDAGQFVDRRPFLDAYEVIADLRAPPILRPNTRFKYSNHGYALLGMAIEAVSGEPYRDWIEREVVAAAALNETTADVPEKAIRLARGHTGRLPVGRRLVIAGDFQTNAIGAAGGFVSTAADLVRFFALLDPRAKKSLLSVKSRREMIRRRWRDPHSSFERHYGLGIISGTLAGWNWYGHSGGLQGYITRTAVVPQEQIAISILTNSIDGLAPFWLDGALHILRTFARNGAPPRQLCGWSGRWWTMWNAVDLVPMRKKVLVALPAYFNPFMDASEIQNGRIALAGGYASHGEPVRLARHELWLGGTRYVREGELRREMQARYR